MSRILKTYNTKLKNRRVSLAYDKNTDTFILRFKRLMDKGEVIQETDITKVLKGKIVATFIELSFEAGMAVIQNFKLFFADLDKDPNILKNNH